MRRYLLGWIACVFLPGGVCAADADEAKLKAAGIPTDANGLAAYFKQRTATVTNQERIKALVDRLGDDEFKTREEASRQLVMLGPRARPFLQAALKNSDPEIARRAQDCLDRIGRGATATTLTAAVRVLARRSSSQRGGDKVHAAAVLLDYLPSAEERSVAETIHQVLPSLAVRDGKAEPALVEALTDKSPIKRGAAVAALSSTRLADVMPSVRKLLHDPDPHVRIRLGLALAAQGDKDAVSVLIRTIDDIPLQRNGLVLELLDRLAAGSPPPEMPVADQTARRKCRQAWEQWWKEHQDKIEAAELERASRSLGGTLIVLLDTNTIAFLDRAEQARWQFNSTMKPLDVQLLPGEERVLIAEHEANRVSERNRKGEIVWKKSVDAPLMAQRLANGNTFIATSGRKSDGSLTRSQVLEIDKDGKELYSYSRPDGGEFMRATKLRGGDIACIVQLGRLSRCVRLTPAGKDFKEVKSWDVQVRTSGGRLDVLPNGHVLIPEMDNNRVIEFDGNGRSVWEATLDQPIAAVRLPNGNTLVTLMSENRAVEVDRAGKEVWQYKADTRVTRALRR